MPSSHRIAFVLAAAIVLPSAVAAASVQAGGPPAAAASPLSNPWLDREPLVIAHQGGNHEAPGNTLFALHEALAAGADAFEVDLHRTADGHVVAIHDATVDRTTNGTGPVQQKTLEEIKKLDPAYWWVPGVGSGDHSRPAEDYVYRGVATGGPAPPPGYQRSDFRIPTLAEILETFADEEVYMVLELKATSQHYRPFAHHVAELLKEHGRADSSVIVASFNDAVTAAVEAQAPGVSTSPGLAQAGAFWASAQGPAPGTPMPQHEALQIPPRHLGLDVATEDVIQDAHANGLAVHVWTLNKRDQMERYLDMGVEGILTDRPSTLVDVL